MFNVGQDLNQLTVMDKYRVTMPGFFIWVTSLVQEKKYDNIQEHPIMLSNTFKKDF